MKSFWSWSAKVLFLVVIMQAWFLYDYYQKNITLLQLNKEYTEYLKDSDIRITELEEQLIATEKKTVDGMLKETNKAMVEGWENLLDKVEQELEKARKAVPELLELEPEAPADTNTPDTPLPDTSGSDVRNDETKKEVTSLMLFNVDVMT